MIDPVKIPAAPPGNNLTGDAGLRILVVEDVVIDAELESRELQRAGIACTTRRVENEGDFRRQLQEFLPDLIISDFSLPTFDGLSALRIAKTEQPDIPFIFMSGTIGEERAIESLKSGASDYVLKNNAARLPQAVLRAVREAEDRKLHKTQQQKIARLSRIQAVLSGINSVVVRIRDREALFHEACAIAVKHGQFRMAWIGVPVAGSTKLTPIARNGFNDGYLDDVGLELAKIADDHGVGGQALVKKSVIVVNDITSDTRVVFKQQALARGYRSLIALPLLVENTVVAVFLIYAADARIFDGEELNLLGELAGNISYALEYIEKEERLNYLAYFDILTGLPNRNLLNDRLAQAISHSKRTDHMTAVAFVDLDHFKLINDSLGHNAGDHLLKVISKRLAGCLRDGDTIARLGGDEFVMVLPDQEDSEATTQIMQRILASAREPIGSEDGEFNTSCSIGVALYPQDGEDVETLLKHADAAMYRAKESGRSTFRFYAEEMNVKIKERLLVEGKLRHALERQELFLNYQPQIDLRTGKIVGAEALVRWRNPELGLVPPVRFIPLAEESDLILSIGEWVMRKACTQNKAWHDLGLPAIKISVNVSSRQFRQTALPEMTAEILSDAGLDPQYLDLELTESVVMYDVAECITIMRKFQEMGADISIDDFGTGYSSLSYLKRFPVSKLKIDQSFVRDIATDPDDAAITEAVISLGHSLGLKVIAEGVETEEQLAFLCARGCDEAQGYYFGKPMAPDELRALLESGDFPIANMPVLPIS